MLQSTNITSFIVYVPISNTYSPIILETFFKIGFFKSLTHNDHRHRDLKKNDFVKYLYSPIVSFY